jgi:hypothetical protein
VITELKVNVMHLFQIATSASKLTYASIGVGLFVAVLYFKLFFQDSAGFAEDAENTAEMLSTPRWMFWSRRSNDIDCQWSELKIIAWLGISAGCGFLAYYQLPGWLPQVFR